MDFVSDSLANGRRLKCLTVADDFSHEAVDIAVDYGISGQYVTRLLDQAALFRGYPAAVRTDNGPEFTSRAFIAWAQSHGMRHILIEPGQAHAERLHRELQRPVPRRVPERALVRDAAPGREPRSPNGAATTTRCDPHGSIGRIPPARFAEQHRRHAGDAARHLTPASNEIQ
jgi:putative transposase